MAIKLQDKTRVVPPSSDFPYGRIKDSTPAAPGTPVNEQVYGDFHQFFAKMLNDSGIVANGFPDNDYSGFQYYEAFLECMKFGFSKGVIEEVANKKLIKRVYPIGAWNMDSLGNPSTTVLFGAGLDYKKISNIQILIFDDANTISVPIDLPDISTQLAAGRWLLNKGGGSGPFLTLLRFAGGLFDSTDYDDGTMNRGLITFEYDNS